MGGEEGGTINHELGEYIFKMYHRREGHSSTVSTAVRIAQKAIESNTFISARYAKRSEGAVQKDITVIVLYPRIRSTIRSIPRDPKAED